MRWARIRPSRLAARELPAAPFSGMPEAVVYGRGADVRGDRLRFGAGMFSIRPACQPRRSPEFTGCHTMVPTVLQRHGVVAESRRLN